MASLFDIKVSVGKSIKSKKVATKPLGIENFQQHIVLQGTPDEKHKKNGNYFCPGRMKGVMRRDEQILHCEIIAIDIDSMSVKDCKMMLEMVRGGHWEYILYTTAQHTADAPRYRLVFKLSRPVNSDEFRCVVRDFAQEICVVEMDKCSLAPSQGQFYPMVWEQFADEAFIEYSEGEAIDVEPYLESLVAVDASDDEFESEADKLPMAIPAAVDEYLWLSCVLDVYPAEGLVDYDEWAGVGFALWHQTDGRALDLWMEWSRKNKHRHAGSIGEHEMRTTKWDSFSDKKRDRLITLRSILNTKTESGRSVLALAYRKLSTLLTQGSDLRRLQEDIQAEKYLYGSDYQYIAEEFNKTYYKIHGEKLSMGDAMMMLKPEHKVGARREYFYNNYMFSESESLYYNINTKEPISIISMNYMYGAQMPLTNSGENKVVHKVLTNASNGFVKPRIMNGKMYEVLGEDVITRGSRCYLNEFDTDSWPYVEDEFRPEEDEVDARIKTMIDKHLGLLCNGDEILMNMIMQHLGHLRQKPMERLHFAYAISSSFHGVGKSTLRRLYSVVLGESQVNLLSASNIAEDFNGYAAMPKLMSFIEEFEFDSRRAQNTAIKKMKDLITSDTVSLRKMRTDAHTAPAYTAYALFSNDEYVLGHESTGRRWVPIIVQAVNEQQCSEALGMPHEQFYREYHELMSEYPERFVSYFSQVDLEGFKTERPPHTVQKQVFIENIPSMRVMRILQELIENEQSIDLTADYACGQSAFRLVRNYLDFNSSVDVDEVKDFSDRQLRHLIDTAIRGMGYHQAGAGNERFRMPFDQCDRTRMSEIWVKNIKRYGGAMGIPLLRKRISNLKRARLAASPNVVSIKPVEDAEDEIKPVQNRTRHTVDSDEIDEFDDPTAEYHDL